MPRLLLMTLAALAVAGCGPRSDDGPINVALIGPSPRLADPNDGALSPPTRVLLSAVSQGLVAFDAAGQIEPALAERWMVTDDGLSYIFRLREARWPDGERVTARQVQRGLRRALARSSDNVMKPALEAIEDVVVVTPQVIEIRLRTARPPLLELLAQPELSLLGANGGAGPFRIAAPTGDPLRLEPLPDPTAPDDSDASTAPTRALLLSGGRAAIAVARFVAGEADLVLGGTVDDLPVARAARAGDNLLRFDPAQGLMGLQLVTADGFLADQANRQTLALALDRARLAAAFSVPGWGAVETVLPESYRSAAPPTIPAWAAVPAAQRRALARERVQTWTAANGPVPPIRIAMPSGPGGTVLWGLIASDLLDVGLQAERVAPGEAADLRFVDAVAPAGSAIWYLSGLGCAPDAWCDPRVAEALANARRATTLAQRGISLAAADRALAETASLIPLARPIRWSLVSPRLRAFTTNAQAVHPLYHLISRTR
ncbi:peptide/nickel transport system substrate-binding protein [Sphingomonas jejuensis]|uniref:Peptide/nickel transport system substrate-binding protein n=1 Tax=Sphingomonas jejuensis TaxID=904715 RepID=A0ABX0XHD2_9SPHN|nr:ABC transporter substrate-binding protein [Sphingomonas jejuensis]NJC32729.1 peptide/nickel transport system substrate-binding protein [Sphingomonas jejuensis]